MWVLKLSNPSVMLEILIIELPKISSHYIIYIVILCSRSMTICVNRYSGQLKKIPWFKTLDLFCNFVQQMTECSILNPFHENEMFWIYTPTGLTCTFADELGDMRRRLLSRRRIYARLRLLPTFKGTKNRFFFYLTKFKSVILSTVYKRKMVKISKRARVI